MELDKNLLIEIAEYARVVTNSTPTAKSRDIVEEFLNVKELLKTSEYSQEKALCEYLGLKINHNWVMADYGFGPSDGGKTPSGWQVVCHISKLQTYLKQKIHKNER